MDLIFCGTPEFAVPTLEKLVATGFNVGLVVTQPDRPSGRGMSMAASPVKQAALRHGIKVTQPERIKNNQEFRSLLESLRPAAIVVVGYGRIIPGWMLALPPRGNINLHASLLPRYRGAAPVQWSIARGDSVTGVSTMLIDTGLDTGPVLIQQEEVIRGDDTSVTLWPRLAGIGARLMVETLRGLESASVRPAPQDSSQATLAPILQKEDGRIDFSLDAVEICNRLRGFQPWPGAYTTFRGNQLAWTQARPAQAASALAPGEIALDGGRLLVGCGSGAAVDVVELHPAGKRRMTAAQFISGYHPQAGEMFGQQAGG